MVAPAPFFGSPGEPVPSVDVEDLQAAYRLLTDPGPRPAGSGPGTVSMYAFESACKPGANLAAVTFRAIMLQVLPMMLRERASALLTKEGRFEEKVFREFASFPMSWLPVGSPPDAMPFDVEEFLRRVR
jgi:hypothetical protein